MPEDLGNAKAGSPIDLLTESWKTVESKGQPSVTS